MKPWSAKLVATALSWGVCTNAFLTRKEFILRAPTFLSVSRYGPPISDDSDLEAQRAELEFQRNKANFRKLLEESMATTNPEHLPRLLANNIEFVMSLHGEDGSQVISELVEEAKEEGEEQFQRTVELVEIVLTFAEDFVEQLSEMDNSNKLLLGKIIKAMASKEFIAKDKEDYLDQLLEKEKKNFTPGFLRHIEGECERITSAPKVTPESARLLEILRIIQTRVLEELGKDMGEATLVLGQLMGYDDEDELLGVLDAGLTVRGRAFAVEMAELTEEALQGFKRVADVDQGLVKRVTFIDDRLREFMDETNDYQ